MSEWHRGGYTISTERGRLDLPAVHRFISEESYWGRGRPPEVVRRAVENSFPFGIYRGGELVGVARETPYNAIHIENMLRLAHAGARIMPASPGFYHRPQTIEQLVDHLVFRILDQFGIPHPTGTRWRGEVRDGETG